MPVTAPGSLDPQQYASIIAYLVSYECVQAAKNGSQPFPTADKAEFAKVITEHTEKWGKIIRAAGIKAE